MTRKHLIAIARAVLPMQETEAKVMLVKRLCRELAELNPNFDNQLFIKACFGRDMPELKL